MHANRLWKACITSAMTPFHFRAHIAITRIAPAAQGSMLQDAVGARDLHPLTIEPGACSRSTALLRLCAFVPLWSILVALFYHRATEARSSLCRVAYGLAPGHARRSCIAPRVAIVTWRKRTQTQGFLRKAPVRRRVGAIQTQPSTSQTPTIKSPKNY